MAKFLPWRRKKNIQLSSQQPFGDRTPPANFNDHTTVLGSSTSSDQQVPASQPHQTPAGDALAIPVTNTSDMHGLGVPSLQHQHPREPYSPIKPPEAQGIQPAYVGPPVHQDGGQISYLGPPVKEGNSGQNYLGPPVHKKGGSDVSFLGPPVPKENDLPLGQITSQEHRQDAEHKSEKGLEHEHQFIAADTKSFSQPSVSLGGEGITVSNNHTQIPVKSEEEGSGLSGGATDPAHVSGGGTLQPWTQSSPNWEAGGGDLGGLSPDSHSKN